MKVCQVCNRIHKEAPMWAIKTDVGDWFRCKNCGTMLVYPIKKQKLLRVRSN